MPAFIPEIEGAGIQSSSASARGRRAPAIEHGRVSRVDCIAPLQKVEARSPNAGLLLSRSAERPSRAIEDRPGPFAR